MIGKNIDWDNLGFNAYKTKSMFKAHYAPNTGWQAEGLIPYGDVTLSPASTILNYGQGIFCLLYTSPSPRDRSLSRMPSSA